MADLSSDSSDSDSDLDVPQNTVENTDSQLDLNTVNDCIREYEKEQKKERKKRFDAGVKTENVIVDESDGFLAKIKLTAAQAKKLAAKERSEKQKQQLAELKEKNRLAKLEAKKNLDLRTDKSKPGVAIPVEAPKKPRGRHVAKPKPERSLSPQEESEEEEKPKKYQARKPKMEEDEEELERKVEKLNKLNQVIESNNPWLARILEARRKH
jgi:hypothetical protein